MNNVCAEFTLLTSPAPPSHDVRSEKAAVFLRSRGAARRVVGDLGGLDHRGLGRRQRRHHPPLLRRLGGGEFVALRRVPQDLRDNSVICTVGYYIAQGLEKEGLALKRQPLSQFIG